MDFDTWEPMYREILEYFGFSRDQDEEAAYLPRHVLGIAYTQYRS